MRDTELYQQILGLSSEWQVVGVKLSLDAGTVEVQVRHGGGPLRCPECDAEVAGYDKAPERRWRHLDTCQLQTLIRCRVPRVNCATHGVKTVAVPWAEPRGRFTLLFQALVIQWLQATRSQTAVAERLRMSLDEVHQIMARAVERGLARREESPMRQLGLDEKSMQRGHRYLTVLCDLEHGCVHDVVEGRQQAQAEVLLGGLSELQRRTVECACMDMWEPFRQAVRQVLPQARIVHDRFHISGHLNDAVDQTRRSEQRQLLAQGETALNRTRYLFLRNVENLTAAQFRRFAAAKLVAAKTAAAWEYKELFRGFWEQPTIQAGRTYLARWARDAKRQRLPALTKVAKMLLRHATGLLNYFHHRVTNAMAENLNGKVQHLKATARGFRAFAHYRTNILFHFGDLKLNPLESQ
jgi:transposase